VIRNATAPEVVFLYTARALKTKAKSVTVLHLVGVLDTLPTLLDTSVICRSMADFATKAAWTPALLLLAGANTSNSLEGGLFVQQPNAFRLLQKFENPWGAPEGWPTFPRFYLCHCHFSLIWMTLMQSWYFLKL